MTGRDEPRPTLAEVLRKVREQPPATPETESEKAELAENSAKLRRALMGAADPAAWPVWPSGVPEILIPEVEPIERLGPIEVVVVESHTARGGKKAKRGPAKGRGGSPDRFYDCAEIVRVLQLWRNREKLPQRISENALARPGFSRKAVHRVIRLDEHDAFRVGPRGGLYLHGTSGNFRSAGKTVSLRALERALGLEPLG